MTDWHDGYQRLDGDPRGLLVRVTGKFDVMRGKIPARSGVKILMGRSRKINSVTHSITIRPEKLGKRDVSRPICSCGWTATWAYVTEKFAGDAGQEHVKQVLADLQVVIG
jgi:hypothetical protein